MHRVVITEHAERDIDEVFAWIAMDSATNAQEMVERIREAIRTLRRFSRAGRVCPEQPNFTYELRQVIAFPYRIIYTVHNDLVLILHVRHGARDEFAPEDLT